MWRTWALTGGAPSPAWGAGSRRYVVVAQPSAPASATAGHAAFTSEECRFTVGTIDINRTHFDAGGREPPQNGRGVAYSAGRAVPLMRPRQQVVVFQPQDGGERVEFDRIRSILFRSLPSKYVGTITACLSSDASECFGGRSCPDVRDPRVC